jgi:phospholipase/carboxylesterase
MKVSKLESFFIPQVSKGHTDGSKIMIVMHGLGDSLDSYKVFSQELNVTGLNYLLVNAPTPYFFGHSWYDIPPGNPRPGIENSVSIILKVIDEIHEQGYDYQDIILCGFSQGGCIALESLYKCTHQLGGVMAMSPRIYHEHIPSQVTENNEIPLVICHGKYDEVIPFEDTQAGAEKLKKLYQNCEFRSYDMGHEIDVMEIMDLREWVNEIL